MFKSFLSAFKTAPAKVVPVTPELIQKRKQLCTNLGNIYKSQIGVLTSSLPQTTVDSTPLIGYYTSLTEQYETQLKQLENANNESLKYAEEDFLRVINAQLDHKVMELEEINSSIKQDDLKSLDKHYNGAIDKFFFDFHTNRIRASYVLKGYIYQTLLLQRHNSLSLLKDAIKTTSNCLSLNDYPIPSFKVDKTNTELDVYCVSPHVVHILFELLKNSTIPSITHGKPINLSVIDEDLKNIVIEVKDNGGGMPCSMVEKIWQFHYTTSNAADRDPIHGFGMGLPLCKVFAKFNNGDLTLINKEGTGVTVLLKIPKWIEKI